MLIAMRAVDFEIKKSSNKPKHLQCSFFAQIINSEKCVTGGGQK